MVEDTDFYFFWLTEEVGKETEQKRTTKNKKTKSVDSQSEQLLGAVSKHLEGGCSKI